MMKLREFIQQHYIDTGKIEVRFMDLDPDTIRKISDFSEVAQLECVTNEHFLISDLYELTISDTTGANWFCRTYTFEDALNIVCDKLVLFNAYISDGLFYLKAAELNYPESN